MTDNSGGLGPDQQLLRAIWRSVLSISPKLEKWATWSVTGVAAIAALLISNIDKVTKVVSVSAVRLSLYCLAASLLLGALSKQCGMACSAGVRNMSKLEDFLASDDGKSIFREITTDPQRLGEAIAKPFVWPLSLLMARSFKHGSTDPLKAYKSMIRIFSWQVILNGVSMLSAVAGIVVLASQLQL